MAALGPHGLVHSGYGSFSAKTVVEKIIGPNLPGSLRPHGLPASSFAGSRSTQIVLAGSAVSAEGGQVTVSVPTGIRALTPLVFPRSEPTFNPKSVGGTSPSVTGAEVVCQAEQLEGCSYSITLDGAACRAIGGEVTGSAQILDISNPNATSDVPSNYEVDDRTGFRHYPLWDDLSEMQREWTGIYTSDPDPRHPQEFNKAEGSDRQTGPQNPEGDDTFLSDTVGPEDL